MLVNRTIGVGEQHVVVGSAAGVRRYAGFLGSKRSAAEFMQ
jgi:hypothetical protein